MLLILALVCALTLCGALLLARRASRPAAGPAPEPPPGIAYVGRVLGPYVLERVLAHGSSGTVFEAQNPATALRVAVKVLDPRLARSSREARAFLAEGRTANAIRDPGVPRVLSADRTPDGVVYLAMELVLRARSLADVLAAEEAAGGAPLEVSLARGLDVLRILGAAERAAIVPLDVSGNNVLVDGDGGVRLVDFGLVKSAEVPVPPRGTIVGTVGHMAPEQARGDTVAFGPRTAVWAGGALLYRMLTGQRVHEAPDDTQMLERTRTKEVPSVALLARVPPGVARAVDRALALRPEHRFASVEELREAIATELAALRHARASSKAGGTRRYDGAAFGGRAA